MKTQNLSSNFMKTQLSAGTFRLLSLALATLFSSLGVLAIDPDLPYTSPSTGADGPLTFRSIPLDGRTASAMAYDGQRKQVVLFGGSIPGYANDTWVLDSASNDWVKKSPATSPSGRYGHK